MMNVRILSQPDDTSCGPTSLHAVYNYFNDNVALDTIIKEINQLNDGGTLAVMLARHALGRGYKAKIFTYNLTLFDPTWNFKNNSEIINKLKEQNRTKKDEKLSWATKAYVDYLERGGEIQYQDISSSLIRKYLNRGVPILVGLSATYLYSCMREYTNDAGQSVYDDVKGTPMGHFVVLCGMDEQKNVIVADPYKENPMSENNYYSVKVHRLINSILLGIVTYDANLLIITPKPIN